MRETRPVRTGLFRDGPVGPVLLGGVCARCARLHFPRAELCPYCSAEGCAERALSGRGHLWLYTVVSTPPPGYRGAVPFGFGVVELDDGLRVVTRLSEADVERLRPGMPVHLVLDEVGVDDDGRGVLSYAFAGGE